MTVTDEIKKMQKEGKSEQEISSALRKSGVSDKEIADAFSQVKIKEAVGGVPEKRIPETPSFPGQVVQAGTQQQMQTQQASPQIQQPVSSGQTGQTPVPMGVPAPGTQLVGGNAPVGGQEPAATSEYSPQGEGYEGMQPSLLGQPQQPATQEYGQQPTGQEPVLGGFPADAYEGYQQYQPYQEALSSDTITEISEQVVNEKLSPIHDRLEQAIGLRKSAEAKLTSLNERLRRIEQIIDRLQLSILQKIGDYVSEVKDVKHELEETQKSFKAIHGHKKTVHHHEHKKKGKKRHVP